VAELATIRTPHSFPSSVKLAYLQRRAMRDSGERLPTTPAKKRGTNFKLVMSSSSASWQALIVSFVASCAITWFRHFNHLSLLFQIDERKWYRRTWNIRGTTI
jgi:hypothetical protein